eukprot:CAMPEP_0206437806 /NCGR_PEP_ID=MMETSP0324_2-20121206/11250_1 /ASSEMBLY_ACC=CAM_ASM_000836 /TAXON_ID=2866 /ORGANISM="Crypthecodinium cohnii, Strain Seligo" /LENGTH=827 /DNA_ID=CAMNT_0053905137 /DNA_START=160 /DNA_END=2642 /DNA_ORIENTATION=+
MATAPPNERDGRRGGAADQFFNLMDGPRNQSGPKKVQPTDKYELGGLRDASAGPVGRRRCTDLPCLFLFLVQVVVFWILACRAVQQGDPQHLVAPRDFRGDYCGEGNLTSSSHLALTLNLVGSVDELMRMVLCQSSDSLGLTADQKQQACASPSSPAKSNLAVALATNTASPAELARQLASTTASEAFGRGGFFSMLDPSTWLTAASEYSNAVCVPHCGALGSSSTQSPRTYHYSPPVGAAWAATWRSHASQMPTLAFEAWPYEVCPYNERYCIKFPGLSFSNESLAGNCVPELTSSAIHALGGEGAGWAGAFRSSFLGKRISSLGDVLDTWDVACVVVAEAFILAFVWLLLIRFCIKPMVWLSTVLVFLTFLVGGFVLLITSLQCAGTSLFDPESIVESVQTQIETFANSTEVYSCMVEGGHAISNDTERRIVQVAGAVLMVLSLVWAWSSAASVHGSQLAIACSRVAAQFLAEAPQVLLVPVVQTVVGSVWVVAWVLVAAFSLSNVPEDAVPDTWFSSEVAAAGNSTVAGACDSQWPSGFAVQEQSSCPTIDGVLHCWRCAPPRIALGPKFAFILFSFLWHNAALLALGQLVVAGAVAVWFFAPKNQKMRCFPLCTSLKNSSYHLGSIALGSLVLATVQFARWICRYLSKQSEAQKNKVAQTVFCALGCCIGVFDRCLRFLTKNAYMQMAVQGSGFCTAAKEAFCLLARNCLRFGTLAMLGAVIRRLGVLLLTALTAFVGYLSLEAMHPAVSPIVPLVAYCAIGYLMASIFMMVFGLAIDATLYCFVITEEMRHRADFIPASLNSFIRQRDLEGEPEHKRCLRCC